VTRLDYFLPLGLLFKVVFALLFGPNNTILKSLKFIVLAKIRQLYKIVESGQNKPLLGSFSQN